MLQKRLVLAIYSASMESTELRDYATEAIKFWEPYRHLYNLALAAIVIAYFAIRYPLSKSIISVDFCLGLFLLAVIANIARPTLSTFLRKPPDFETSGAATASCCL